MKAFWRRGQLISLSREASLVTANIDIVMSLASWDSLLDSVETTVQFNMPASCMIRMMLGYSFLGACILARGFAVSRLIPAQTGSRKKERDCC